MKATPSGRTPCHYLAAILPAGLFVLLAAGLSGTAAGQVRLWEIDWVPALGVKLALRLDGLSMLFGLVITAVGTLVTVYSGVYLGGHPHSGRYQVLLQSFMLAMLGLVLADNLILLFVFWEVTTFTSFLLIGFTHDEADARESARQALFVTGAGGLAMLAGFILIGQTAGTYSLTDLLVRGGDLTRSTHYPVVLTLVLAGAFTKSAQFPFHFWLPNAMTAPTPISAFLHSATMVKAGIYLLARLHPVLAGPPAWTLTLTLFGAVTALTGAILAFGQTDLKRVLAYTTLMALGMLTLFLGGDPHRRPGGGGYLLSGACHLQVGPFSGGGYSRPRNRHPAVGCRSRACSHHALDRGGHARRRAFHGRFSAFFRFRRQGDHVRRCAQYGFSARSGHGRGGSRQHVDDGRGRHPFRASVLRAGRQRQSGS